MAVIIDTKLRVTCSLAKEIVSAGQVVDTVFSQPCPFGKTKVDAACANCKHSEEEMVDNE